MSSFTAKELPEIPGPGERLILAGDGTSSSPLPVAARYGLSLALVGAATIAAFVVDNVLQSSNLSLIFVLPVVVAAASFGWGPALIAAVAGVLVFDFLFVEPRYTLAVANPADLWALVLFLVIAAIVSSVAAQSRRRALVAREAADQAGALQALAHVVIQSPPRAEVASAAATALAQIFKAPAVVLVQSGETLGSPVVAGGADLSAADQEAARLAFTTSLATRADTYPVDRSSFDFWPVETRHGRLVLGVNFTGLEGGRPAQPEQLVDLVGGYLAQALARER